MRKPEQRLWDRMRQRMMGDVYLERMENVVQPGRPDIDAMWEGIMIPIELKVIEKYPIRGTTPVLGRKGLNQNQLNWWLRWREWGGTGFIVISVKQDLFIVPAAQSDRVNRFNYSQLVDYHHQTKWQALLALIKEEVKCVRQR